MKGEDDRVGKFKRQAKVLLPRFFRRAIHHVRAGRNIRYLENVFHTRYKKNALFSYISAPFINGISAKHHSYVAEWTYTMLMDARSLVLRLWEIVRKYGYGLKDCHPYNILYDRGRPYYVDFGSIVPGTSFLHSEFLTYYLLIPALLRTSPVVGRAVLRSSHFLHNEYLLQSLVGGVLLSSSRALRFLLRCHDKCCRKLALYRWLFYRLFVRRFGAYGSVNKSYWSDYQELDFSAIRSAADLPERFGRYRFILQKLQALHVHTVLEFGANGGLFAVLASQLPSVAHYIATDYDEHAIDSLYRFQKSSERQEVKKILPLVVNLTETHHHNMLLPMEKRLRAEAVLAMALTHHLLLTQGYNVEVLFRQMAVCTERYLLIEFMPLGLWDGSAEVRVPRWYTLAWFQQAMAKEFRILSVDQLEKNRILLVGEKKAAGLQGLRPATYEEKEDMTDRENLVRESEHLTTTGGQNARSLFSLQPHLIKQIRPLSGGVIGGWSDCVLFRGQEAERYAV